nr:KH domain-containing, RNA-binding, signal transduction-associated protein 1 [Ciona intestinalis]|eukprot:XP_018670868.1 KH domain-containing, RNA-binding, signal transduction-associated protein 1 [Ciona intestinalis]
MTDLPVDSKYLPELMAEKDSIDPSFVHAVRLISSEIEKIKNPPPPAKPSNNSNDPKMFNIYDDKYPKVECNIRIPVNEFPRVNFIGRLIGPGGSTLKGIQEVTNTRIAILGKGSLRDKKKAEELANSSDVKYNHLKYPLHVRISAIGSVDQAYMSIGRACSEVSKLLMVEDEDEYIAAGAAAMLQARGGAVGVGGGMRGAGRGAPRGVRGGGRGAPRGSPSGSRGSSRGGRGARGGTRGGMRGAARGAVASRFPKAQIQAADSYVNQALEYAEAGYDVYSEYAEAAAYDPYGQATEEAYNESYADGAYGVTDSYDAYTFADYESYGNGAESYVPAKPAYRGKIRGGARGRGAGKPY